MGGGQIDGDAADREGEAAVLDGGAYPVPGLVHRRVGQPHHGEGGQAAGQVALGHHLVPGDAVQAQRAHGEDHGMPSFLKRMTNFSVFSILPALEGEINDRFFTCYTGK